MIFNLDLEYDKYLRDYEFSNYEKYFIDKLKDDLKFIIDTLSKQKELTMLKDELHEEKFDIKINDNVNFKGFVDKIIYLQTNKETLVSVIDYKTGNPDINLKLLPYGLSMQLPVYLYLIKNSNRFDNMKILGIYLQHILSNEYQSKSKKTLDEQKKDNLKLTGFSINDTFYLEYLDKSYENSELIKGMKTNKDGSLSTYAKALNEEDFDKINGIVSDNIKKASDDIWKGIFPINPKVVNKENIACKYCKYQDICYMKESDKIYIDIMEEGDINA